MIDQYPNLENQLTIATWNIRDQAMSPKVQRHIFESGADIFALPELAAEGVTIPDDVHERFHEYGYRLHVQEYQDNDGRQDRHQLGVAVKTDLNASVESVDGGTRAALKVLLGDSCEALIAHLDDRHESRRIAQTEALLRGLGAHAIFAGDLNTMPPHTTLARALRLARPFVLALPSRDPIPGERTPRLQRFGSLSQRLSAMALGGSMRALACDGFVDAANDHAPTLQKGPFKAQLDHIMYRGNFSVTTPTQVHWVEGFDHAIVSSSLRLTA